MPNIIVDFLHRSVRFDNHDFSLPNNSFEVDILHASERKRATRKTRLSSLCSLTS